MIFKRGRTLIPTGGNCPRQVRRHRRKSTLITAQLPIAQGHAMIGEPTIADAILDRIIHNAHRLTLEGDSMRKQKTPPLLTGAENGKINRK